MSADSDFDTAIALSPEQYVIRELRSRLVGYEKECERTMARHAKTMDCWDDGRLLGVGYALITLDDLCESQGVTL